MNAPTDEQLLREHLQGKTGSFELLVRRHVHELHQFAMRFTGNSAAAEDVVQETLLQIHTSAASFDPTRRFKPWLFTIAANKGRDYLRRKKRKREFPLDAQINDGEDSGRRFVDLIAGDDEQPFDQLHVEDRRRTVKAVVDDMPDRLRELLVFAYYHRFAYKEIAEILGIPLGTVKSRLHAAVADFAGRYRKAAEERIRDEVEGDGC